MSSFLLRVAAPVVAAPVSAQQPSPVQIGASPANNLVNAQATTHSVPQWESQGASSSSSGAAPTFAPMPPAPEVVQHKSQSTKSVCKREIVPPVKMESGRTIARTALHYVGLPKPVFVARLTYEEVHANAEAAKKVWSMVADKKWTIAPLAWNTQDNSQLVAFNCHTFSVLGAVPGIGDSDWLQYSSLVFKGGFGFGKILEHFYTQVRDDNNRILPVSNEQEFQNHCTTGKLLVGDHLELWRDGYSASELCSHSAVVSKTDNTYNVTSKLGGGPVVITSLADIMTYYGAHWVEVRRRKPIEK